MMTLLWTLTPYFGNHTFLDHISQGNFDQHGIVVPMEYKLTWFGRKHFAAEKNADVSTHMTV